MRRLPVVQSAVPEDDAASHRPRWRWWLIGVLANLVFWLPLCLIALWIASAWGGPAGSGAGSQAALSVMLLSYAAASAATGAILGRFALKLGPTAAASTAITFAALATLLALALGAVPLVPALLAAAVLGIAGASGSVVGFFLGRSRR